MAEIGIILLFMTVFFLVAPTLAKTVSFVIHRWEAVSENSDFDFIDAIRMRQCRLHNLDQTNFQDCYPNS